MVCVNQTWPHCVNQMGKNGMAGEQHGMCESAFTCQIFKDPLQTYSNFHMFCIIIFHGYRGDNHANICQQMKTEVVNTNLKIPTKKVN
jgi:hypothetical protein